VAHRIATDRDRRRNVPPLRTNRRGSRGRGWGRTREGKRADKSLGRAAILARSAGGPPALDRPSSGRDHELLASQAAAVTGGSFEVIMSAERAGAYKTDPRAYRAGLAALGLPAERLLFVAGSAHNVPGAGSVGMPVYWSNRRGLTKPLGRGPIVDARDLRGILDLV
jgi:hypothetical protein